MIDDIVSMAAACARAKVGRAIDVADAERIEIGHERGGVREREIAMQLQAISRARATAGIDRALARAVAAPSCRRRETSRDLHEDRCRALPTNRQASEGRACSR